MATEVLRASAMRIRETEIAGCAVMLLASRLAGEPPSYHLVIDRAPATHTISVGEATLRELAAHGMTPGTTPLLSHVLVVLTLLAGRPLLDFLWFGPLVTAARALFAEDGAPC